MKHCVSRRSGRKALPVWPAAVRSIAPDFTTVDSAAARSRIAQMLTAGLPLPTVANLFGLHECDLVARPKKATRR